MLEVFRDLPGVRDEFLVLFMEALFSSRRREGE
jgi:hypothetical protein